MRAADLRQFYRPRRERAPRWLQRCLHQVWAWL